MADESELSPGTEIVIISDKEIYVEIGARIKLCRRKSRMSLADLGGRIGVSYQQMQKYETGANRISLGKLRAVAEALNVDLANLLAGLTPGGREGGVDAMAQLSACSESRRLNWLFDALNKEEDRAFLLEFAAYLVARERRSSQGKAARLGIG